MRVWGTIGVGVALVCAGCSGVHSGVHWMQSRLTGPPAFEESAFARKPIAGHRIAVGADTTVIGRLGTHRVRPGETFFEIARYYDLGYGELVEANPGIDPLIPPVGKDLVLPTEWILPCCTYDGIVVNVPEMRLYFYRHAPDDPKSRLVETFPVGIGRESWRTPRGQFHIRRKTVNPRWVIPESIRQEHIREYGDARHSIAGGDPENPLGKYRMELSLPPFSIHGTDIPWGIGMQVTHGCVRLYPEDMEHLFPLPPVVTRAHDGRRKEGHRMHVRSVGFLAATLMLAGALSSGCAKKSEATDEPAVSRAEDAARRAETAASRAEAAAQRAEAASGRTERSFHKKMRK